MKIRTAILAALLAMGALVYTQTTPPPKAQIPSNMRPYYMVLATKGPNFQPFTSPEGAKGMVAHLDWIRKLGEERKVLVAGPTTSGDKYVGVYFLKATSEEAAKKIMDEEPSVKAGAVKYEMQAVLPPNLDSVKFEYAK